MPFLHHTAVRAELVSVIRGKDHHGVLVESVALERVKNSADGFVDHRMEVVMEPSIFAIDDRGEHHLGPRLTERCLARRSFVEGVRLRRCLIGAQRVTHEGRVRRIRAVRFRAEPTGEAKRSS
jgi:hypothetical protein